MHQPMDLSLRHTTAPATAAPEEDVLDLRIRKKQHLEQGVSALLERMTSVQNLKERLESPKLTFNASKKAQIKQEIEEMEEKIKQELDLIKTMLEVLKKAEKNPPKEPKKESLADRPMEETMPEDEVLADHRLIIDESFEEEMPQNKESMDPVETMVEEKNVLTFHNLEEVVELMDDYERMKPFLAKKEKEVIHILPNVKEFDKTKYKTEPNNQKRFTTTTRESDATTSEPFATTSEPFATTSEPFATTSEPFATTSEPFATTSESCANDQKLFITTSESCANDQKLFITTSEPSTSTSEPFATTNEPYATTREPYKNHPEPIETDSTVKMKAASPLETDTVASEGTVPKLILKNLKLKTFGKILIKRKANFGYLAVQKLNCKVTKFSLGTFYQIVTINNCENTFKQELNYYIEKFKLRRVYMIKNQTIKFPKVKYFCLKKKDDICAKCKTACCTAGRVATYILKEHKIKFDDCEYY